MTSASLLDLWHHALTVVATVAAPFLLTCLALGLTVAVIQTATQLQESVLTFVPKLAGTLLVIALAGHWMLDRLGGFMQLSFTSSSQHDPSGGADLDGVDQP